MIEIASALSAITAAIGLAKELGSADREFDKADLKLKAADLKSALADAKFALTEARDELRRRDDKIEKLKQNFRRKGEMVEYGGFIYEKRNGTAVGSAFCPHCMSDGIMSRLNPRGIAGGLCPNCKSKFSPVHYFQYPEDSSRPCISSLG